MHAGLIERIETGAERGASALFALAVAYATYAALRIWAVRPEFLVGAAGMGALAYLPCSSLLGAVGAERARFALPSYEPRALEPFEPLDELLLTDADRLGAGDELVLTEADRVDGGEPLLLDDVLAEMGADSRVVRLFDRTAMPTPGELQSRIAGHLGGASPVEAPADASQALSDALAELRRSLA